MMPATCVPWPLSSAAGVPGLTQLVPWRASRSELARSTPVSSTATGAPPEARTEVAVAAPMRRTPGVTVSPEAGAAHGDVGLHEVDERQGADERDLRRGEVGREALDGGGVAEAGDEAGAAAALVRGGVRLRDVVLQHDDVRALLPVRD